MRKILFLFLALSFLGLNAQKKKKTVKKKKAKTTKTTQPKADAGADMGNIDSLVNAYATPAVQEVPDEPITSMSILNAKSPESFRKYRDLGMIKQGDSMVSTKKTPLKYGFIEDKDILKSMVVWEIIDMNDKLNQPYYHNEDGVVSQNKSLYQILFDAINDGSIKEVYDDELFMTRLSPEAAQARTKTERMSDGGTDLMNANNGVLTEEQRKEFTNVYETKTENVKVLKIKGMWYIDRRDSQMKYRLLGIAAMGQDPSTMGQFDPLTGQPLGGELIDLFWVYYPDAREVLANAVAFNNKNLASDITFDDLLNSRRFSTVIYKSDNGLGNGVIKDYIPRDADAQLEESEAIKAQILQMENDMWNY